MPNEAANPLELLSDIFVVYRSIAEVMPGSSETIHYENLLRANNESLLNFITAMESLSSVHSSHSAEVPS